MHCISTIAALSVFSLLSCGGPPPPNPEATVVLAQGTSKLVIHIENPKTTRGPLLCDLFHVETGFPGASPIIGGSISMPANTTPADCIYDKLPAGTYAMSVIQDENSNGTLDSNLFGSPTEGYGASNNILPATSAPSWKDSKFELADGQTLELNVRLANSAP